MVNDAKEFALWLSPHILDGTERVLREFYGWSQPRASQYQSVLERIASRSGGAVITPRLVVADCNDWEDNRILELAAESGAILIVSNDDDLLRMSPWRGTPVIHPTAFVAKVDAMRRAQVRILRERPT